MFKKTITESLQVTSAGILKTASELIQPKSDSDLVPMMQEFNLPRDQYRKYLLSSQSGQVREIRVGDCRVFLLSQYGAGLNLYKMLNFIRPSGVLLQVRPDDIFTRNFRLSQSEQDYLRDIRRDGSQLMPSAVHYYNTSLVLKRRRILVSGPKPQKTRFIPYDLVDRVHEYSVAYAARWGINRRFESFYVGDLPRESLMRRLMGSLSLMQVQNMFSSTCRAMQENPDILLQYEPHTPLSAAYKIYPDLLVAPSDRFLAKIVKSLSEFHSKLFLVLGNGQCDTLPLFLEASVPSLSDMLTPSWIYTGFLSTETYESIMEKRALLDVVTYGLDLVSSIQQHKALKKAQEFTAELIKHENEASGFTMSMREREERTDMLQMLYLSCVKKYKTFGTAAMKDGRNALKTEFLQALL